MPVVFNVLRYNATERHIGYLLPSLHGCCKRLGARPTFGEGLRGRREMYHGGHGSSYNWTASLPVLVAD